MRWTTAQHPDTEICGEGRNVRVMGRSVLAGEVGFIHDKVNEGRSGRAHGLGESYGRGEGPGR